MKIDKKIDNNGDNEQSIGDMRFIIDDGLNIPYGWQYDLDIQDKSIKQSKLFRVLKIEAKEREHALPTISQD